MKNTILNDDTLTALKKLPSDLVDLGVTSPPYNKGENKKGWLVKNVKYSGANDKNNEEQYQQEQIDVLNELFRITKDGGSFFYNHKVRWDKGIMMHPMDWIRKTKWAIRQEIIWDRMIAANIRGWRFWQVEERIYWLYKPINNNFIGKELSSKHALLTSIWRLPPERKNPHPAPFPLAVPTRIIYSLLENSNATVIDPYSGSGTTLVSAKLLGHNYIGIEKSKEYVDFAENRIKNAETEREILNKEIALHKVEKTFAERKALGEPTGKHRNIKKTNGELLI